MALTDATPKVRDTAKKALKVLGRRIEAKVLNLPKSSFGRIVKETGAVSKPRTATAVRLKKPGRLMRVRAILEDAEKATGDFERREKAFIQLGGIFEDDDTRQWLTGGACKTWDHIEARIVDILIKRIGDYHPRVASVALNALLSAMKFLELTCINVETILTFVYAKWASLQCEVEPVLNMLLLIKLPNELLNAYCKVITYFPGPSLPVAVGHIKSVLSRMDQHDLTKHNTGVLIAALQDTGLLPEIAELLGDAGRVIIEDLEKEKAIVPVRRPTPVSSPVVSPKKEQELESPFNRSQGVPEEDFQVEFTDQNDFLGFLDAVEDQQRLPSPVAIPDFTFTPEGSPVRSVEEAPLRTDNSVHSPSHLSPDSSKATSKPTSKVSSPIIVAKVTPKVASPKINSKDTSIDNLTVVLHESANVGEQPSEEVPMELITEIRTALYSSACQDRFQAVRRVVTLEEEFGPQVYSLLNLDPIKHKMVQTSVERIRELRAQAP